jgi:outer membrane lipoprotein-sorting protein
MSPAEQPTDQPFAPEPAPKHRRRAIRWVAPVAAAALALGGGLAANGTAAAEPTLPKKSPQQLLTSVAGAKTDGMSGTVTETANLGLPSLPGLQNQNSPQQGKSSSDFSALLSGTHTLKVWTAGQDKSRVALLGKKGESDAIRNGHQGWLWSSAKKSATHLTFPRSQPNKRSAGAPNGMPATPQQAAKQVLRQIGPTTKTSVARNVTVAGRPAYQLVLQPKQSNSLVSRVRIAVDGKNSTPLRVQVLARGQDKPALSVGFQSVNFSVPKAKTFSFSPPAGAKVTQQPATGTNATQARADSKRLAKASKTIGKGWTQVQVTDLCKASQHKKPDHATPDHIKNDKQLKQALKSLPKVSGSWGSGRLVSGSLFSAVLTDNGKLAVGAVKPAALYHALNS